MVPAAACSETTLKKMSKGLRHFPEELGRKKMDWNWTNNCNSDSGSTHTHSAIRKRTDHWREDRLAALGGEALEDVTLRKIWVRMHRRKSKRQVRGLTSKKILSVYREGKNVNPKNFVIYLQFKP